MDLFLDFPLTTLFGLAVAVWVAAKVVRGRRPRGAARATCPHCGTGLPPVARFCRQCGREAAR